MPRAAQRGSRGEKWILAPQARPRSFQAQGRRPPPCPTSPATPPAQLPEDEARRGRVLLQRRGVAGPARAALDVAAVLGKLLEQQRGDARLDGLQVQRRAQQAVAVGVVGLRGSRGWGKGP
jgi:hypothetical protein